MKPNTQAVQDLINRTSALMKLANEFIEHGISDFPQWMPLNGLEMTEFTRECERLVKNLAENTPFADDKARIDDLNDRIRLLPSTFAFMVESNPLLVQTIAKNNGFTVGSMRTMVFKGLVTASMWNVWVDQATKTLEEKPKKFSLFDHLKKQPYERMCDRLKAELPAGGFSFPDSEKLATPPNVDSAGRRPKPLPFEVTISTDDLNPSAFDRHAAHLVGTLETAIRQSGLEKGIISILDDNGQVAAFAIMPSAGKKE